MSNLIEKDALKRKHCDSCACKSTCMGNSCKIYEARCLIADLPTIEADSIDKAAILRLCNEINDEVTDIVFDSTNMHIYECCGAIREYLKAIEKELTGDAGTD